MKYIEQIEAYRPETERDAAEKQIILDFVKENPKRVLLRESRLAHMTSSGFLVNRELTRVLLIHHHIYNTWAWTGGHSDGDQDLLETALREAREETGLQSVIPLTEEMLSLRILNVAPHVRKGEYVPAHLHLSSAYVLVADEAEPLTGKADENSGARWFELEGIASASGEREIVPIYEALLQRARGYLR